MTDRELLELAAKAAGLRWQDWTPTIFLGEDDPRDWPHEWNPLTDDGDALRLAVRLGIAVYPPEGYGDGATCNGPGAAAWITESDLDDPYAATRRAIVRAAAEIGRQA